jgi:uridine kinase
MTSRPTAPVLLIAGGAGSGKTHLARALAQNAPGTQLIHLDLCYHTDPDLAPSVPRFDGPGRVVDFSDPAALDPVRIKAAMDAASAARNTPLIIVEGVFALTLPELEHQAAWTVFVDAPADIRLVRKALRKLDEGKDPITTLRGYERNRAAYERYVHPTRERAQLVLDGTLPVDDLLAQLNGHLATGVR